jgi:hypothetical protein
LGRFLLVISGYIIAEAGVVVLTVIFIDIIWLRAILIAIIPIIFVIAAIRSDND